GAGLERISQAADDLAQPALQLIQQERARAKDMLFREQDTLFRDRYMQLQIEGKQRKLRNAHQVTEELVGSYEEFGSDALGGIQDPDVQDAARAAFDKYRTRLKETLTVHEAQQNEELGNQLFDASMASNLKELDLNFRNPTRVDEIIDEGVGNISRFMNATGQPGEAFSARVDAYMTKAHETVIRNLVRNGQPDEAKTHFEINKERIDQDVREKLEDLIRVGDLRNQGQKEEDRIMSDPEINRVESPAERERRRLTEARKLTGELRDEVLKRIKVRNDEERILEKRERDETYDRAVEAAIQLREAGLDIEKHFNVEQRSQLTNEEWDALLSETSFPPVTNDDKWLELADMSTTEAGQIELSQMSRREYDMRFRRHFSRADRRAADGIYVSARGRVVRGMEDAEQVDIIEEAEWRKEATTRL
ncbi:MAG TPA: hypothetical protein VLA34_11220, partial [Candidatus Krumholzibacterium sp.]|nr:hypothetical protein [Candidatus Krumholzibacterium sp.]